MFEQLVKGITVRPVLLGMALLVPFFSNVYAATSVSGPITANTLWTLAQSPYQVTSDVTVESGATLTIEAGVTVYFGPGTNLIVSAGALNAVGTLSSPIVFTSVKDSSGSTPAPGDWGQLRFLAGTFSVSTVLEHAQVKYGQGISIQSASPTLNYLKITNNAAAAISMDLQSSPSGTGIQASGNNINGVAVPAGDILGNVAWKLSGIPYVVQQGVVSVGAAPKITSVQPATVQQGQTLDVVVSGTRLAGVESVSFDAVGVTATLSAGASDTSIPLRVSADATQPLGNVAFVVQAAAGKVRFDPGISIIPSRPTITASSITPTSLRRGENKSFQINGSYLQGAQVSVPSGSGLTLSNLQTTDTQASFNLTASVTASLGTQALTLLNPAVANGSAVVSVVVVNALPTIYTSPSPLSVSPDSVTRSFFLRLSNSDTIAHTLNLSVVDPTIASVSPLSFTLPAGTTEVAVSITGLKLGYTVLNITSPTLASVGVQIYVTDLLNGAVIGPVLSSPVGVYRPIEASGLPVGTAIGPIVSSPVGVIAP